MARGHPGYFGKRFDSWYIWLPLCLLFVAPFFDPRRPFRMLHLDLLVLLGFGASHFFFNRGDISASVPLAYPVLLYLLARMAWIGFRPRERAQRLVPRVPVVWIGLALVFLVGFRVALNVVPFAALKIETRMANAMMRPAPAPSTPPIASEATLVLRAAPALPSAARYPRFAST